VWIGWILRAELQLGIEVVDFPEKSLALVLEGAEVMLAVRVIVAGELVEAAHFAEDCTDAVLPERMNSCGYDQVPSSEARTKRVIQSGDDCRAIGHGNPPFWFAGSKSKADETSAAQLSAAA
jgi:hypothetical protein